MSLAQQVKQLADQLQSLTNNIEKSMLHGVPVGTLIHHIGTVPPVGFLEVDGSLLTRGSYPELWDFARTRTTVVTEAEWTTKNNSQTSVAQFSSGDGSTTFRLPKIKDFLRGADPANGRDFGLWQGDAIRNIVGELAVIDATVNTNASGAFNHVEYVTGPTSQETNSGFRVSFDASRVVPTANENRPKSVNCLLCIKAFDAVTNAATLDMAALAASVASKVATLDWDKARGSMRGLVQYSVDTVLTLPDVGKRILALPGATKFTLPKRVDVPDGSVFYICNKSNGNLTVEADAADAGIFAGATDRANIVLPFNSSAILATGATKWNLDGGDVITNYSVMFDKLLAGSGHLRVGEFIIQWGASNIPVNVSNSPLNVTFPKPFPNGCYLAVASCGIAASDLDFAPEYRTADHTVNVGIPTATGVEMHVLIHNLLPSARRVSWIAIGH